MKKIIISCVMLMVANVTFAQNINRCGTTEYLEKELKRDPSLKLRMEEAERKTQEYLNSGSKTNAVIHIPVVVHIVYNTTAENILDARVNEQIARLNKDFRKTNADTSSIPSAFRSLAADSEIEFCLANKDPDGNSTSGITRTQTSTTSFSDDNKVKSTAQGGKDPWDHTKYLNIWVCNLGGGLLGYATSPGAGASTDGVVVLYSAFGNTSGQYNLGRTATHEVGHYFNLAHTFQDGCNGNTSGTCASAGDRVCDTPQAQSANFGCKTFPHNTSGCSENSTNGEMYMNYMDYGDDACILMFTTGQKNRMIAAINSSRSGLISSANTNCTITTPAVNDAGVASITHPTAVLCGTKTVSPIVKIKNFGTGALTSCTVNYKYTRSGSVSSKNWTGNLASGAQEDFTLNPITISATDTLFVYTSNPNNTTDGTTSNDQSFILVTVNPTKNIPYAEQFTNNPLATSISLVDRWTAQNVVGISTVPTQTWIHDVTVGNGDSKSMKLPNFENNYAANATASQAPIDYLYMPRLNLSGFTGEAKLKFDVAYARRVSTVADTLSVQIATECGDNWVTIYKKGGDNLRTKTDLVDIAYVPTSTEWRNEEVNITSYSNKNGIRIRFISKSCNTTNISTGRNGNNIYLDNINIDALMNVKSVGELNNLISVYPNPANEKLTIQSDANKIISINIVNNVGQVILTQTIDSYNSEIDINHLTNGFYFVTIKILDGTISKKISVIK